MTLDEGDLRARLTTGEVLVVPGVANALTAKIAVDVGFDVLYVTGAGVTNTHLGMPDMGLLTLTQMADHVSAIRDVVDVPLIVDADTGFGNAVNVGHTVRVLQRAGASAIQLEDQVSPKKCGHFEGKQVMSAREMESKIHAAVDARDGRDFLVVARTDARAISGIDDAIERGQRYADAGADIIFVEAPVSLDELGRVATEIDAPTIINIVEGGLTQSISHAQMSELGFDVALYANLALLAMMKAVSRTLGELASGQAFFTDIASWEERQRLVGKPEFDAREARYAT